METTQKTNPANPVKIFALAYALLTLIPILAKVLIKATGEWQAAIAIVQTDGLPEKVVEQAKDILSYWKQKMWFWKDLSMTIKGILLVIYPLISNYITIGWYTFPLIILAVMDVSVFLSDYAHFDLFDGIFLWIKVIVSIFVIVGTNLEIFNNKRGT